MRLSSVLEIQRHPWISHGCMGNDLLRPLFGVYALRIFCSSRSQERSTLSKTAAAFFFNVLNIIPTIALAGISLFRLGTLCLICLGTYSINIAMLYYSHRAHALGVNHENSVGVDLSLKHAFSNLIVGCGAILLALHLVAPKVVSQMVGARALDDSTINQVVANFADQPSVPFDIHRSPSFGPDNAPIVVVEFSDFQCPHCAISSKTMPSFLKAYAGQVKYVYKFYPLDSSCNPEIKSSFHALACRAAKTSYCVFKDKGSEAFFRYKSKVFDAQETMSPESILSMAKEEGLEESAIKVCVDDPATHQFILDNVSEGTAGKVAGTPAIFVNGRMVVTGPVPQILTRVFDLVLDSMKR